MSTRLAAALAAGACVVLSCTLGNAQESDANSYQQQRAALQAQQNYRDQVNENVLFLMSGPPGGSYQVIAHDIASVVNDGLRLRVLPVAGNAAVQNISDVLFLRGIDLSLTMIQVISHLKQTKQYGGNLEQQIVYIAPLSNDEMHVFARSGIKSIADLKGKKVNFNVAGSATALLGPRIFKELKIDVQAVFLPQGDAVERMRRGEIAATVCICAKPVDFVTDEKAPDDFKLLDVPFVGSLQDEYLPATLTAEDYPHILAKNAKIETLATTTVLVSFNWPRGSVRYNRTAKFVEALFTRFPELQRPPRHPAWKSINLAAPVGGLQRFPAAQDWLSRNAVVASSRGGTQKSVAQTGAKPTLSSTDDTDKLFREFMDYTRKTRR
jgi:uncharacterized protein